MNENTGIAISRREIIEMAAEGRPELAAVNAGLVGRPRLAAYVAKFPHSSGHRFTVRQLVRYAVRAERRWRSGKDIWGNPV